MTVRNSIGKANLAAALVAKTAVIPDGSLQNDKLAVMPANTVRANTGGGAASPSDVGIGPNELLGRGADGLGAIPLGAGLSIVAGVLTASGGGGSGNPLVGWFA